MCSVDFINDVYEFYVEDGANFKDMKEDLSLVMRFFIKLEAVLKLITYPLWVILMCLYEAIYIGIKSKDVKHIGGLYRIVFGKFIPCTARWGFWLYLDIITTSKYNMVTTKVRELIKTVIDILKDDVYGYVLANLKD